MRARLGALVVLLAVSGCGGGAALQDEASCPGADCTKDTRDRLDAIAALDGVTEVESVTRSYGLDSGSAAVARVGAAVGDRGAARDVGEAVLRELDAWPGHDFGVAQVTVVSDPEADVDYVARRTGDLTNPYFERCAPARCEQALADLRERMLDEIDGLDEVDAVVRGGTLRITGGADPEHYAPAAAGARRLVFDTALRLADRLEVEMTARGPLELTLRLEDGLVCEQPAGTVVACENDNSKPLGDS